LGLLSAALLVLLLPACGKDGPDGPEGPSGAISADDVRDVLGNEIAGIRNSFTLPGGGPGCLTIAPWPPIDLDEDAVPDTATYTYDQSGCGFSGPGYSSSWWGTIVLKDPGEDFGYTAQIDMGVEDIGGEPQRARTRLTTGTRTVGGSPTSVILTTDLHMEITSNDAAPATVEASWTATFTPADGETVVLSQGMLYPPGTISIEGNLEWTQGGTLFPFTLETVEPLVCDPDCESPFAVAGELWATLTAGATPGVLRMTCTGCGTEIDFDWEPED
jgi:hypothetical protein